MRERNSQDNSMDAAASPFADPSGPAGNASLDPLQGTPAPLSILLPWPLSTNKLWRAVRMGRSRIGNILSAEARDWKKEATVMLSQQSPRMFHCPVEITIALSAPTRRAFDLDNRTKIILDLLVSCAVIQDDSNRFVKRLLVEESDEDFTGALVTIAQFAGKKG